MLYNICATAHFESQVTTVPIVTTLHTEASYNRLQSIVNLSLFSWS